MANRHESRMHAEVVEDAHLGLQWGRGRGVGFARTHALEVKNVSSLRRMRSMQVAEHSRGRGCHRPQRAEGQRRGSGGILGIDAISVSRMVVLTEPTFTEEE
mmetsp:Transcript_34056/g.70314  ORF Transcript_34056/g.70314 Transcript_34056/m.70314 type:complete len:102 (-) Transcript_34056:455-760(-)